MSNNQQIIRNYLESALSLLDVPEAEQENDTETPVFTIVTNADYAAFLAANLDYPKPPKGYWDELDKPVTNVSYNDALNYCVWSGTRLPTEKEWREQEGRNSITPVSVWEWTSNREGDNYVLRGGSFLSVDRDHFRCAYRYCNRPAYRLHCNGFRVAKRENSFCPSCKATLETVFETVRGDGTRYKKNSVGNYEFVQQEGGLGYIYKCGNCGAQLPEGWGKNWFNDHREKEK